MESIPPPVAPKKLLNCSYSVEERKVFNVYKIEYRSQISSPGRKQIFRSKILPAIFNHWRDVGRIPETDKESAERIKVLLVVPVLKIGDLLPFEFADACSVAR